MATKALVLSQQSRSLRKGFALCFGSERDGGNPEQINRTCEDHRHGNATFQRTAEVIHKRTRNDGDGNVKEPSDIVGKARSGRSHSGWEKLWKVQNKGRAHSDRKEVDH